MRWAKGAGGQEQPSLNPKRVLEQLVLLFLRRQAALEECQYRPLLWPQSIQNAAEFSGPPT